MKKLYIVAKNHMDPSWLRCFRDHFVNEENGGVIRPYSDIEELQILEYMDFAEKYGVKYQIEQSLVVKEFLNRNPDQKERFIKLVQKGLLELAGGGETVIDYNLTQGESWARNHLYSRKYYQEEFDHAPKYAITPDIFGLPSQLPQFFRSIGYDALILFDRVMLRNKPYWRGLDGTKIVLDACFLNVPEPGLRTADCVKIPACNACHGEGCEVCEGTGIDFSYTMTRPDKDMQQFREAYYGNMSAEEMLGKLLEKDSDTYFLMIVTEEPRVGEYLYGPLEEAAKKMDFDVQYLSFEENHDRWCPGQVEALRTGNYTEDEVDTRAEGNPVFSGCYSSRIEIKKENRELEDLLGEAERLAVLARLKGGWNPDALPRRDYPQKKIEALWNKMAFIQFHDCIPGSHCDAGYYEIQRYIREVKRGAEQIYNDAALECLRSIGCEIPEGYKAAVYFNTDTAAVTNPRLTIHASADTKNVEVYDTSGNRLLAYNTEVIPELVGTGVKVSVCAEVPALGWKIFLWKPVCEAETITVCDMLRIENAYYSITADQNGVTEIYDKKNHRPAASNCGLSISIEKGDPWGRHQAESGHIDLLADSVSCEHADGFSRLVLKGVYSDAARKVDRLAWTQTITLNKGEALVRVATDLDWDGTDSRIFASVVPAFEHGGKLIGEVPFGTMERDDPQKAENPGLTDEWPTLGFAGVSDGTYNLAVLKGGFPGTRLHEAKLQLILLRAFDWDNSKFNETDDRGHHTSEYAIATWSGSFADGCCSAMAASYNRRGLTRTLTDSAAVSAAGSGCMLPALTEIPGQIRLSALKWAEDGTGPVVRFWESTGTAAVLKMPAGVKLLSCDTLENPIAEEAVSEYGFRPFEIATFRLLQE